MHNADGRNSTIWDFYISSRKCDQNQLHWLQVRARKELRVTAHIQSLITRSKKPLAEKTKQTKNQTKSK